MRRSATVRILLGSALVDSFGTGCFLASSVIYFVEAVGVRSALIGVGLTAGACLGFVATVPVGRWADRRGPRQPLLALLLVRALGFAVYAAATSFPAFVLGALVVGLGEKPTSSVQQYFVSSVVPESERQRTLAMIRSARNLGLGLGSLVSSVVLVAASTSALRWVVLANVASFLVCAAVLARLRPRRLATGQSARTWRLRDRRYVVLTGLNGILTCHMVLLALGIPLWLVESRVVPAVVVPLMISLNTALAVLFQVPVARWAHDAVSARRCLVGAGAALAVCCAVPAVVDGADLAGRAALVAVVTAVVALTLGEMLQAAGGWELSYGLAPPDRRGEYLAFFSLGVTAQSMIGPVLVTTALLPGGGLGWLVLAAVLTISAGLAARLPVAAPVPRAEPASLGAAHD